MRQSAFLCATIVAASFAGVALPAHGQQARREHAAATRSQTQKTDKANQDAAVADEASGASEGAQPSRAGRPNANQVNGNGKPAPPSYGPMLNPRQPKGADPARKDPAEVRDETDSLAREAQSQQPGEQLRQLRQQSQNPRQVQRRHPAWQSVGPLAPRSSGSADSPAIGTGAVPIPPPAQAPQPVVPSSRALNCVGGACLDAAGGSYNLGPTGVGVSSSGRLCSSSGTTVQCF
jgi:FtsZ-interacting cell division protein ZipA